MLLPYALYNAHIMLLIRSCRRLELATLGEKALAALAPRVRAPGTPQAHLHARRAALAALVVGQVVRHNVRQRADEDGRVVERFRALQIDAELRGKLATFGSV
jgi:hypothetical protein